MVQSPSAILRFVLVLAVAGIMACPSALAQHEHGMAAGVVVSHDVPADGRTYVGDVSHFGILDLGDDAVPDVHQQNHIRVSEDGVVLFETTADTGHDYDGVNTFDVAFPVPGNYTVEALAADGMPVASFSGYVVPADASHQVALTLHVPAQAMAGELVPIDIRTDEAGAPNTTTLVDHSDTLFEVRQGDALLFRSHLHSHTAAQDLGYAFEQPGTYTLRAVSYLAFPSAKAHIFVPHVAEATISIAAAPPTAPGTPVAPTDQPMNTVVTGTGQHGNFTLLGTFDPYTQVGPTTQQHLDVLVMDPATRHPVQHVDFSARLTGPDGAVLFTSQSLHEYDGIYELTAVEPVPGAYRLLVDAKYDAWTGHIELPYTVVPPSMPIALDVPPAPALGPELVDLAGAGALRAGVPANLSLTIHDALGNPLPHSEIDVQVLDAGGLPVLQAKLHTHDGSFPFQATFAAPGSYTLRLAPFPTDPQPVIFYGAMVGGALDSSLTVGAGPGVPAHAMGAAQSSPAVETAPGIPLAFLLAALGAALLVARRR